MSRTSRWVATNPRATRSPRRLTLDFDVTDALSLSWRTEGGSYDTKGRQIEIFGETPITSGSLTGLTYSQIVGGPVPAFPQGQNITARNNVLDFKRSSNGDTSDMTNFETALTAELQVRQWTDADIGHRLQHLLA